MNIIDISEKKISYKTYWHVIMAILNKAGTMNLTRKLISDFTPESQSTVSLAVDSLLEAGILSEGRDNSIKSTSKHYYIVNIDYIFELCCKHVGLSDDLIKEYTDHFTDWLENESIKNNFFWIEFEKESLYFTLFDDPFLSLVIKYDDNLFFLILISSFLLCYKDKQDEQLFFQVTSQIRYVLVTGFLKSIIDLPGKLGPELFNSKFYSFLMKYFGSISLDEFRDLTQKLTSNPVEGQQQIDQFIALAKNYSEKSSKNFWSSDDKAISIHIDLKSIEEIDNKFLDQTKPINVKIPLLNGKIIKLEVYPFQQKLDHIDDQMKLKQTNVE